MSFFSRFFRAKHKTTLTRQQLKHVKQSFISFAGSDVLIDREEWKQVLAINNQFLLNRIFQLVDTDESGFIDLDEFIVFSANLFAGDKRQRLEFIFRVYDIDGDGTIDAAEIKIILEASLAEQQVSLDAPVVTRLVKDFLQITDLNKDHSVSLDEFIQAVGEYPGIDEQLFVQAADWLGYQQEISTPQVTESTTGLPLRQWWRIHRKGILWGSAYLLGNILLFQHAMQTYAALGESFAVQIARGAGACLNLNAALILIPVCKSFWTWARQTRLANFFPIEDPLGVHRTIANTMLGFTALHVSAHLYHYAVSSKPVWHELSATQVGLTGTIATLILVFMFWNGQSIKQRRYEWFAISHLLYAVFIAALLYHSPTLLLWLTPSLLFFFADSLVRALRKTKTTPVAQLTPLSNGVTKVAFAKPLGFKFYPGDYVRLQIPAISKSQWHPFTISAAPESESMELFVRNNGDWSGALHNLSRKKKSQGAFFKARIDGPYATPSSSVHRAQVAILIAAGIGVTPYASLLHSLVLRNSGKRSEGLQQHIYFHWLNRSQLSYEWFIELLNEAEDVLGNERFKLNIHLTSLTYDLTNIAMQVAMDAYRSRRERDPITGLFVQTSAGRPNWDTIFKEAAAAHPNEQVEVYFCGPPNLGDVVRESCDKHGFFFHNEKF